VRPGGNFGDELIYLGCEKMASEIGLDYQTVSYSTFISENYPEDVLVYIHGGGGVNPYCSGKAIELIIKAINFHKGIVIVGPQTYYDDKEFLKKNLFNKISSAATQIHMFARDNKSFSIIEMCSKNHPIETYIDHDTALNLEKEDFITYKNSNKFNRHFIREDKEKISFSDSSDFFAIKFDPTSFATDFETWVNLHSTAKTIFTNRLHSAIAGKIFGKNVFLLPNIYHKNRSVWEYSLSKYPNIMWLDVPNEQFRSVSPPLAAVSNSRVFQKLLSLYCLGYYSFKKCKF
jgi:exopolysaccharide biosynthesis predicted pyruvyltransferase EpsI